MSAVRAGAVLGGVGALAFALCQVGVPPWSESLPWFPVIVFSLLAALYGASLVRSVQRVLNEARSLVGPLITLGLLSTLPLYSHYRAAQDAREFLATADSVKGEVVTVFNRSGPRVVAAYHVGNRAFRATSPGFVDSLAAFGPGDSIWLFFPPGLPDSVRFGHPSADTKATRNWLLWLWVGAGPIVCGYGSTTVRYLRPSTYAVPRGTA